MRLLPASKVHFHDADSPYSHHTNLGILARHPLIMLGYSCYFFIILSNLFFTPSHSVSKME